MAQKLLTVVGGTGTQGLSVIDAVLNGTDGAYQVRAITRNPTSSKAQALRERGVEVVQADVNDGESLFKAFEGSSAIFGMTDFFETFTKFGPAQAIDIETSQGIHIARAASKTPTLEHFIWSTLPNAARLTGGLYQIPHFVGKNRVDDFIRDDKTLFSKTTFFWITFYGNNFQYPVFTPNLIKSSNSFIQLSPASPTTPIKTIGGLTNVGVFALAILKQPHKTLNGAFVVGSVEDTTTGQMLEDWAALMGKRAVYVQTPLEHFSEIWPGLGLEMGAMMEMWDKLGDKSWSGEDNMLTKEDLGLSDYPFVGLKMAMEEMDWKSIL